MDKHEEWMQSLVRKMPIDKVKNGPADKKSNKWLWVILIGFVVLALIPRLWFIFKVSTPDNPGAGWFGDAYHHWQIAYLTKEIGLNEGFLRLWDLKGMEFFWGLLHPLLTVVAFSLTGNFSIAVERSLTAVFGSISVALVYLVVSKYWNKQAGAASAILAALNPVGIFNDVSGMVEPLGIPFLLLGIYLWPKIPFWSGFVLVLALMARAEYWVFAIGLIVSMIILSKKVVSNKKTLLVVGFMIPLILYMKYLLDWTGNPFYPFYQNYLTNIFGTWQFKTEFSSADIFAKHLFQGILALTILSAGFIFWKKPKGSLVYLLGIGNWMFLGATFGVGAYIGSYMDYVWYVRFMILPYIFIGILICVLLFYYLPKIRYINLLDKIKFNWIVLIAILILVQPVWKLIMKKYNTTEPNWKQSVKISGEIMKHYRGGKIVFVEGNPEFTYALVKVYGFKGKNLVSQMFDPYFYFTDDPYQDWGKNREVVFDWLKKYKIRTIVTYSNTERYAKLAQKEPEYIAQGKALESASLTVYQVDDEKIQRDF